jgi:hypothetical protein
MDQSAEYEWRYRQCGTLLGVERGGKMHLKYKTTQFVVSGPVMGCAEGAPRSTRSPSCPRNQ